MTLISNRGFTLFEVMISTTIIVIMAAIATPSYLSLREGVKFRSAVSNLCGNLQYAKTQGILDNVNVVVLFNPDGQTKASNKYQIFTEKDAEGEAGKWKYEPEKNEKELKRVTLPAGIQIDLSEEATTFSNQRMRFNIRGLPSVTDSEKVTLTALKSGRSQSVSINLIGRIQTD